MNIGDQLPRRKTTRLPFHDYSSSGWYYVTICTKNRKHYFGTINNGRMALSECGKIVKERWQALPNHHSIFLDELIIMPNHIHGIIVIEKNDDVNPDLLAKDVAGNVPTRGLMSSISPKPGSLSTIIRSFKSSCTKEIQKKCQSVKFAWQSRFYDHIIRDQEDLERIRHYIHENPKNWESDELF